MAKTALYNMEGKAIGEVELSDEIFAAPHVFQCFFDGGI